MTEPTNVAVIYCSSAGNVHVLAESIIASATLVPSQVEFVDRPLGALSSTSGGGAS
jgi:hypothetical protein